jgi:radical SAM protein with 4Fe4S-binding SPASM domain
LKLDSGSHPNLYKVGLKLHKISPDLWDYGVSALNAPSAYLGKRQWERSDKALGGKINSVNLEVTILCNLRCTMCWWWGQNGIAFKFIKERDPMVTQELTTQEIFSIVDQLAPHKPSIYLSGGEPFIRKDTVEIIEYIASKGMSVITNNNGTVLSDEKLQRLAKIKQLTVNFSIDGPREVHDKIRGQGTYDKTTSTIKKLVEYRGNDVLPAIKTNTTFSPWIAGHLDELIHSLQDDANVDAVRMQHLWFTDKEHAEAHKAVLKQTFGTNEGAGVDSHIISSPTPDYARELAKEIMQVQKTRYKKPVFIHPKMTEEQIYRYYTDLSFTKQNACYIAWNSVHIKANGDVMFCPDEWMTDFKLGNIRKDKIDDMWQNDKAKQFRRALYEKKLFPACARCCAING